MVTTQLSEWNAYSENYGDVHTERVIMVIMLIGEKHISLINMINKLRLFQNLILLNNTHQQTEDVVHVVGHYYYHDTMYQLL